MRPGSSPSPKRHYTPDELRHFQEEFARQVIPYRQYCRRALFVVISVVGLACLCDYFVPHGYGFWVLISFGLVVAVLLIYDLWHRPRLSCPACQRPINLDAVGDYCPECGSGQGITQPWFGFATCDACGKKIQQGEESRGWKVHACTHCGVYLDPTGL